MNKKEKINELINEAINSVDNIQRANPMPFLLTRVNARLNKKEKNVWEKAGWLIGRPAYAIPGLAMLILINVMVVVSNRTDPFTATTEQPTQYPTDEFSYTVSTIYDIENPEPQ
ncbi:MAG: hypothetical protein H7Z13_18885 [Ferruginibacter sp.]|nr:hypothetical protein [Ferruginibacter sp.]